MSSAHGSIRQARSTRLMVCVAAAFLLVASTGQGTARSSGDRAAASALHAASGHLSPDRKCAPVCGGVPA